MNYMQNVENGISDVSVSADDNVSTIAYVVSAAFAVLVLLVVILLWK